MPGRKPGRIWQGWSTERAYLAIRQPYYAICYCLSAGMDKRHRQMITAPLFLLDKMDSATIDKLGDSIKGKSLSKK
jgi:hypothetical protein